MKLEQVSLIEFNYLVTAKYILNKKKNRIVTQFVEPSNKNHTDQQTSVIVSCNEQSTRRIAKPFSEPMLEQIGTKDFFARLT